MFKTEVSLLPENLFENFFYFPLSRGFFIGNGRLKFYCFDFLESFHLCYCNFYNSLQHIIFQKSFNFFSRILIDIFSCQITNQLKSNFG